MLYGSTLVSDESPFDLHQLTEAAARGEAVFNTRVDADGNLAPGAGNCSGCHSGALFSQAAVLKGADFGTETAVNDRPDGTGAITPARRDRGFFDTGVLLRSTVR